MHVSINRYRNLCVSQFKSKKSGGSIDYRTTLLRARTPVTHHKQNITDVDKPTSIDVKCRINRAPSTNDCKNVSDRHRTVTINISRAIINNRRCIEVDSNTRTVCTKINSEFFGFIFNITFAGK